MLVLLDKLYGVTVGRFDVGRFDVSLNPKDQPKKNPKCQDIVKMSQFLGQFPQSRL